MLIDNADFTPSDSLPDLGTDSIYRFCSFTDVDKISYLEATCLGCTFTNCHFYWSMFNIVLFHECTFENCTFAGVTFADCRFVDSTFDSCTFTKSNLGGSCAYPGTVWYGCKQSDCQGWEGVW